MVSLRLEKKSVGSVIISSLIMALSVIILLFILPINSAAILFVMVIIGAGIYMIALFGLDRAMYQEIRDLVRSFGGPWPHWLDRYFT
jgi:uncharacterized RDD family membrane protein YckC